MKFEKIEISPTQGYVGRRAHARRYVVLRGQVRCGSQPWVPTRIVDLCRDGFCLSWLQHCTIGTRIWIRIEGLEPLPATVRWKNNRAVGCEFSRPLGEAVLDHLAGRRL